MPRLSTPSEPHQLNCDPTPPSTHDVRFWMWPWYVIIDAVRFIWRSRLVAPPHKLWRNHVCFPPSPHTQWRCRTRRPSKSGSLIVETPMVSMRLTLAACHIGMARLSQLCEAPHFDGCRSVVNIPIYSPFLIYLSLLLFWYLFAYQYLDYIILETIRHIEYISYIEYTS